MDMEKTYTYNELCEWCKKAFASGYSEGLSDGHPMALCRGELKAFNESYIEWYLHKEMLNQTSE
jgi:hypothetical protein